MTRGVGQRDRIKDGEDTGVDEGVEVIGVVEEPEVAPNGVQN